jgi:hypothetical protein
MNIGDFRDSRYLTKEDVGNGTLLTIARVSKENVALKDDDEEIKPVVFFQEVKKGFVCNKTNAEKIIEITGEADEVQETWIGKKIVLWSDPNVSFGSRKTGGIRVKQPSDLPF